ncbi:MAG: hypothetical protein EA376_01915 [Phycisphaeraceae bacterium]|nr:MAG: hypothetical protein EA376_01915 [Phycisphaeraceae bacterium]
MGKVRYTEQFKRDAVRLVVEEGYSAKRTAEAVGVTAKSVRDWVARAPGRDWPRY